MRIVGIDPGLLITGYGVVDFGARQPKLVDGGVFRFLAKTSLAHRLVELETELNQVFDEHKPDICAVEQLYALQASAHGDFDVTCARGDSFGCTGDRGIRLEQYSANRIKKSVMGHGHAGKMQIQRAIQQIFILPALPEPADVADALAVALCCGRFISDRG